MQPEPEPNVVFPPPIYPLIERVKLMLKVDSDYTIVYFALMRARHDNFTKEFLDEFSHANTLERQAEVLEKWLALV